MHTHGHTTAHGKSPTYQSWSAMKTRCYNPNQPSYVYYGAKGITVCDEWRDDFFAFLQDMGERPAGHTLGRINNSEGYRPGNVEWQTTKQQAVNRSDNVLVTLDETTLTASQWAERLGSRPKTLRQRLAHGWDDAEALLSPTNAYRNRQFTFRGLTLTINQWAERLGVEVSTLRGRILKGWTIQRALTHHFGPVQIEFNGLKLSLPQWAERLGINQYTLRDRLAQGWTVERTLSSPVPAPKQPKRIGAPFRLQSINTKG